MISGEFPAVFTAELPADFSQKSFLRICFDFWQKITQESFLRIHKTAGNYYLRKF
jgi:hypothetical protein